MSHPAFTDDDKAFLRGILAHPAELTAWLVYADWLDERADPRAEFVRLMVRRSQLRDTNLEWYTIEERLNELRPRLDPDWVTIFDRPKIENCTSAFRFQCPKQWESLTGTDEPTVRRCGACEKSVHYCHTRTEAQAHARQGHCVAVQLGVLRYPGDLVPPVFDEDFADQRLTLGEFVADYEPAPRRPWWKFW